MPLVTTTMTMTSSQILQELEELGTEQNRKVYRRHGPVDPMFGVSYANLKTLLKKVKVDHESALELWATGNHDARIFATMIADPKLAHDALLDGWIGDCHNYVITDAVGVYAGKTSLVQIKAEQWTSSGKEWVGAAGWTLVGHLAMQPNALPDPYFVSHLATIVRDLHGSMNRVSYAMNNALIAIGLRNAALEAHAMNAARQIGKVIVDHGDTGCKTPDAIPYMKKANDRKKARSAA